MAFKNDHCLQYSSGQPQRVVFIGKAIVDSFKPSSKNNSNDNEYLDSIKTKYFYLVKRNIFLREVE